MTQRKYDRLIIACCGLLGLASPAVVAQCRYTWVEIPNWQIPNGPLLFPWVTGMNDVGQVVGYYLGVGGESATGFIWSQAEGVRFMPQAGIGDIRPADINDFGEVVGSADDSTHHFAFYWNGGDTYVDLGYPPSGTWADAHAINNLGQIVGT